MEQADKTETEGNLELTAMERAWTTYLVQRMDRGGLVPEKKRAPELVDRAGNRTDRSTDCTLRRTDCSAIPPSRPRI